MSKVEQLRKVLMNTCKGEDIIDNKECMGAFKDAIEKVFPDNSWWEVIDCENFNSLFSGKKLEQVVDEICKRVKDEFKESIAKTNDKKLVEGTSNFMSLGNFPLLVFYTYDEVYDMMKYDSEAPSEDDFDDYNDYLNALDDFEQAYFDNLNATALDEDEVSRLEETIKDFNYETERIANDLYNNNNDDDYYPLKEIKVTIEPGYYAATQLYVKDEVEFKYLSDEVKQEQFDRFNRFFKEVKKEFGLTQLGVSYRFSNGETGYHEVKDEELKEEINFNKEVWEGWTVQDFIDELEPIFDMIMRGESFIEPFKSKEEVAKWCVDNQPYYKKRIPEVINYFASKLNESLKEDYDDPDIIEISEKEKSYILNIIEKQHKRNQNAPEVVSTYDTTYEGSPVFEVELGNSNPLYITELENNLDKLSDEFNIEYDYESNDNGFYGRTYTFYKFEDENIKESCNLKEDYFKYDCRDLEVSDNEWNQFKKNLENNNVKLLLAGDYAELKGDYKDIRKAIAQSKFKLSKLSKANSLKKDYNESASLKEEDSVVDGYGNALKVGDKIISIDANCNVELGTIESLGEKIDDNTMVHYTVEGKYGVSGLLNKFVFKVTNKFAYVYGYKDSKKEPKFVSSENKVWEAYDSFSNWSSDMYGQGGEKVFVGIDCTNGHIIQREVSESLKEDKEETHFEIYDKEVKDLNATDEEIAKVIKVADDYEAKAQRHYITYEQMDEVAKAMGLESMSDKELRRSWDLYYSVLSREAFRDGNMDNYHKYSDAASAFAEVINREARKRKEAGNYDPDKNESLNESETNDKLLIKGNKLVRNIDKDAVDVVIPDGIIEIGNEAFVESHKLLNIKYDLPTIEDMFKSIGVQNVFDSEGFLTNSAYRSYGKVANKYFNGDYDALDKLCSDEKCFKESLLTEKRWSYTLKAGSSLRDAINNEDAEGIRQGLLDCYKELFDNDLIDEYDYEDWTEEVEDAEFIDENDDINEDEIDFQLDELYDLCDNINVFIALEESLKESDNSITYKKGWDIVTNKDEDNDNVYDVIHNGVKEYSSDDKGKCVDYINKYSESLKESEDDEIISVLGIEQDENNPFFKDKENLVKQYKELKNKFKDEKDIEIYLKGDDTYWKDFANKVDSFDNLDVVKRNK